VGKTRNTTLSLHRKEVDTKGTKNGVKCTVHIITAVASLSPVNDYQYLNTLRSFFGSGKENPSDFFWPAQPFLVFILD
jgi:hypothetical protein